MDSLRTTHARLVSFLGLKSLLDSQSSKLQLMYRITKAFDRIFNCIYFVKNRDMFCVLNTRIMILNYSWFNA